MKAARRWMGIAAVTLFYVALVVIAEIRSSSVDSMSATVTSDDARERCTVESVFVGDGAVRGRHVCQQTKQGQ
ncbi:hypothetical protein [Burkholderia ubonensis]|uniref:hypothetical protein n=1 Tax=Burkholderia ubonensis TaxID=101571 RepID=UPI00116029B0|nr:hypothetical protein [Burkholderia ubonensis]